ncbi:MAG: M12 family metallo-peptidase, partial [Bacteroidota bacterium]
IYDDPATDPSTPDGAGGDHRVNQAAEVIAMNFAENTYDVGQVFHNSSAGGGWSGGGVAGIGVACNAGTFFSTSSSYEDTDDGLTGSNKAAAWSGSFNNTGNGWIQLSAHELGHQFNAAHTFNGSGSSCFGGNAPQNDAYEIASGTTLMSYNGLCGAGQNIPDGGEDDNYFHSSSINRMINYITFGTGNNCGTDNMIANTAPTINANPNNQTYTIPINTPFELVGTASDAENDDLTYCWEQYDEDGAGVTPTQGKIGTAAAADPLAPLFRSFPPSDSPNRTFPSLTDILEGNNTGLSFEALPSVDRSMTFAFTVRDNNPLGGSVVCDNIEIDVENTGGAFEITSQNVPTTLFNNGSSGTFLLEWEVAGTTGGNIQCAQVDILFSTDGGMTFPTVLATNTANDGNETLNIPSQLTTTGRIKIIASNNIFFDINNAEITITDMCEADGVTFSPDDPITADEGDSSLDLDLIPNYDLPINEFTGALSTDDLASNLAFDDLNGNCFGPSNANNYDVFEFFPDISGNYTFTRSGTSGQLINLYEGIFNPNNVCSGWLGSTATRPSGVGGVSLGTTVTVNLNANTTYSLVVSTFDTNPSRYGNYTVNYTGTGQLLEEIQPDPGFGYTYVIVNSANNNIVAFEDDPDLRTYVDGNYTIYGLEKIASLSTTTLNNDYAGGSFSDLQNDISADVICADLSSNTKAITINDTGN